MIRIRPYEYLRSLVYYFVLIRVISVNLWLTVFPLVEISISRTILTLANLSDDERVKGYPTRDVNPATTRFREITIVRSKFPNRETSVAFRGTRVAVRQSRISQQTGTRNQQRHGSKEPKNFTSGFLRLLRLAFLC